MIESIPDANENLDLRPSQSPGIGRSNLAPISNSGDDSIAPIAGAFASVLNRIFSHVGYIISLTAFSLLLSAVAFAEEESQPREIAETSEQATPIEPAKKSRRVAFPPKKGEIAKVEAEKTVLPKRAKPHFAGVRRTPETESKPATPQKKSRKIKNEWFSSKTQPKNEKKTPAPSEERVELPDDRPYFVKTSNMSSPQLLACNRDQISMSNPENRHEKSEGLEYPRTGFLAPFGHIYFTGEWLYWRTRQEGMEFATSKQVKFDFQSGFRAGVGAHLPSFDGWTIYANYTRFNPHGSHKAHNAYPLFLFQGSGVSGNATDHASGYWKIEFQNVDLQFGKAYYLTKTLVFSPFFGMKGAWIDQHAHFSYHGGYIPLGETFRTRFKNDFKGAGPLIGTEINWQLGAGFSFFGDAATSLVIGQFLNTQKQYQLGGTEVVYLSDDFHLVSPFLQLAAGLAWDYNFHRDKCHFGLSLGFEAQQWWNQNQTEQFTDDVRPTYFRQRGDLAFYGLTLKARIDF